MNLRDSVSVRPPHALLALWQPSPQLGQLTFMLGDALFKFLDARGR